MDEEDSQDEMINRNVSHGKGKRPAMSIISDDEDNSEEGESEEEDETGSEEDDDCDEQEVALNGEEEDEDDSADGDSGKVLEGAVGDVTVDPAFLSSDEESEKCPICLNSFHEQPVATPETCEHYFCLDCILEWSKNANSCPVDRIVFSNIVLRKCLGGKAQKTIAVKKAAKTEEEQVDVELDQTSCEVCGGQDREDRLLLCDGCDAGYHMECLTPPLDAVPVEEWFCPECIASNRNSGSEQISEEERNSRPTTSHPRTRPTRAIARTQQSERVRANVNRHRITQARSAEQLAPRYMMQSTWLDETINAVVAGLNTAVYVRDLSRRRKPQRRRKTVKRRKTKSASGTGGKQNGGVKRRKRKVRKVRRKKLLEKGTRGRLVRNLGITKPKAGSTIPSVYRPFENSLGSMRAEIGAASLSVYGDPFDLDPFSDRDDDLRTPSSVLEAKHRGLSHSALRSHQPVARPISSTFSRQGAHIQQMDVVAEEAPVSDLLGSILSGQSMLLMDSSDVVINRDGSLKAAKPVSISLQKNMSTKPSSGDARNIPNPEASILNPSGEIGLSTRPLRMQPLVCSSSGSTSRTQNPTSPNLFPSQQPRLSPLGHPGAPHRPLTLNPSRFENSELSNNGVQSQPISRVSNGLSDTPHPENGTSQPPPIKKPAIKPVWMDVSVLPKIPKIKRESVSDSNKTGNSGNNSLPFSSGTSLAGNTGRQQPSDHKEIGTKEQNKSPDVRNQRVDRTGASSFSSSFTSITTSSNSSSNSNPSSSSVSFRINFSGNPLQARRLPAFGGTLSGNDDESNKRKNKSKQMLLSLRTKVKEEKCEVYDPFNPTGSDSSDSESDVKDVTQNSELQMPVEVSQIKSEDVDPEMERSLEHHVEVKTPSKPNSYRGKPCRQFSEESTSPGSSGMSSDLPVGKANKGIGSALQTQEKAKSSFIAKNYKSEVKSESEEDSDMNLPQASERVHCSKELPSVNDPKRLVESCRSPSSNNRKQLPSNSSLAQMDSHRHKHPKEKKKSHSSSEDQLHPHVTSKERRRSRSKERRRPQSRDRRCSSSSSSGERRKIRKKENRERNDHRGRDRRRNRSQSRSLSRSRSRERKRSSREESRNTRRKSRSTSRERKRREDSQKSSQSSTDALSVELHMSVGAKKGTPPVKKDTKIDWFAKTSKDLNDKSGSSATRDLKSRHGDQTGTINKSNKQLLILKSNTLKHEETRPLSSIKELKDIKKEEEVVDEGGFYLCGIKEMNEGMKSADVCQKEDLNEDGLNSSKNDAVFHNVIKDTEITNELKIEQIWPDEVYAPSCSDVTLITHSRSPNVSVLNCKKEPSETEHSPLFEADKKSLPLPPPDVPIKQEDTVSSDEDVNVDYLIDNLDFIKKEIKDSSAIDSTEASNPNCSTSDSQEVDTPTTEAVATVVKPKPQGKRVTWNLQEPVEPQPGKISKLALFKQKLKKQEGFRKSVANLQNSNQEMAFSQTGAEGESGKPKSNKEASQDGDQKEKYMKKLHMQERAIEEVKLALKPFYQKREITKEEYKEILGKAVQKVCHSKSGEINPVKVANLVKAYVDKYKHARKHKKEETGDDSQTSGQPNN